MTEQAMFATPRRVRALSLLSGGLDSRLAVCVLREQGVDVHGIVFDSPFFDAAKGIAAAERLRIPLQVVDFSRDILELLRKPPHGFGSCMNPCIDCHARMLLRAGQSMRESGFDFLSTGEVLNQRPMSQRRRSMETVARDSGCADLIVRPLSARLLPPTLPERERWIDRSRLLGLQGRSRKPQMALAETYAIGDYPAPAGGCRLTEPGFCKRLADLQAHEGLEGVRALTLLRYGRHFRLAGNVKLIVGRNEQDNMHLEGNAELYDLVLKTEAFPGPTGLVPIVADERCVALGAAICVRYSDAPRDRPVTVRVRSSRGIRKVQAVAASPPLLDALRI